MLMIAKVEDGKILARWDGWYINASEEAEQFIKENNLTVTDDEITFMGNRVLWVE